MKNSLILLAEIIATDNNFAQSFYSKQSIEEKFKLAKTKFVDLSKEDFVKFYNELQELEKSNLKLYLSDLENISGGIGNSKIKLAALAFLGLTLAPMVASNMVSADPSDFYKDLSSRNQTKENPKKTASQKRKRGERSESEPSRGVDRKKIEEQIDYYKKIGKNFGKEILKDGSTPKKIEINFNFNNETFELEANTIKHIIFGEYDEQYSYHKEGGHTAYTLKCLEYINEKKLSDADKNHFKDKYKDEVLNGKENPYEVIKEFSNGVKLYKYYDTLKSNREVTATVFPEKWFDEQTEGKGTLSYLSDRLKSIAEKCFENGKKFTDKQIKGVSIYIASIDNVCIKIVVGKNHKIRSIYPLEIQERKENGKYDFSSLNLEISDEVKLDDVELTNVNLLNKEGEGSGK